MTQQRELVLVIAADEETCARGYCAPKDGRRHPQLRCPWLDPLGLACCMLFGHLEKTEAEDPAHVEALRHPQCILHEKPEEPAEDKPPRPPYAAGTRYGLVKRDNLRGRDDD